MTAVADVGEAIELTFITVPGSTVTLDWLDPLQSPVFSAAAVAEVPANSGKYPKTLLPHSPGMWTATFTATGPTVAIESYFVRVRPLSGPPPLAAFGDVAAQYGAMTEAQQGLTTHLVRAASTLLRQRARQAGINIDAEIAAGRLDPDVAALAVTAMVLRVLRNPNGLRAETVGPFSRTFDTTVAAGLLVVSDDDLGVVTPVPEVADGIASLGVGTIRVTPGLAPTPRRRWPYRGAGPHAGS